MLFRSRDDNMVADVLYKLGSKRSIVPPGVFVQALNSPLVKLEEEPPIKPDLVPAIGQQVLSLDTDWRSPIIDFIKNNKSYPKGKEHEKACTPIQQLCRHRNRVV